MFNLARSTLLKGIGYGNDPLQIEKVFDGLLSTNYSSSSNFSVGWDFGSYKRAIITKVRFFLKETSSLVGSEISGSNDGSTWTSLYILGSTIRKGWNLWKPTNPLQSYRYIVIQNHSPSTCTLSELEVYGYFLSEELLQLDSNPISVDFSDGYHIHSGIAQINYKLALTPVVTNVSPRYGKPEGGYPITITGIGFGSDASKAKVKIDSI